VEVQAGDGSLLLLDCGTGGRALGLALAEDPPKRIDLLLTHLHLDHVEGLGFFGPLWDPRTELHIWGPPSPVKTLEERLATLLSPPLFPVHLADVPSHPEFHDVPQDEWRIGSITLRAEPISHPGPTVGYRLEEDGRSLAYMPDHEPALGVELADMTPDWISGFSVAQGAEVLFHDSQYTAEEYATRVGWGHSNTRDMVTFARRTGVGRLVMFHHDPLHSDADLESILMLARELWNGDGNGEGGTAPVLAHEGMEIDLPPIAAKGMNQPSADGERRA
jgi:ribonuclease BN (tRNA processing enzyme)